VWDRLLRVQTKFVDFIEQLLRGQFCDKKFRKVYM